MYTALYKQVKPYIYQTLDEFYQDLNKPEYTLSGNAAHTLEIQFHLSHLINTSLVCLLSNQIDQLKHCLDQMEKYCNDGLDQTYCRVGFNSTTGPYSVRLQTINRIRAMLDFTLPIPLPEYNKPSYTFTMDYSTTKMIVDIREIRFSKYHVIFELNPRFHCIDDSICHHVKWNDCMSYESLTHGRLPHFLTSEFCQAYNDQI